MSPDARRALQVIRQCVEKRRVKMIDHFFERMEERGLFWADVQAVIDAPTSVKDDGVDHRGGERWLIAGMTIGYLELEIVCVIDADDSGERLVLVTLYVL